MDKIEINTSENLPVAGKFNGCLIYFWSIIPLKKFIRRDKKVQW